MQVISDIFSNFVPNLITLLLKKLMEQKDQISEERRLGKECRSLLAPYH